MSGSFQRLYCEYFQCSARDFERRLFRQCLYRHARVLACLLERLDPDFFHEDFGFIRDLASTTCRGEVLCELNRFFGRNVRDRNWIRRRLMCRISGKRVLLIARGLFRLAREQAETEAEADNASARRKRRELKS